MCSVHEQTSWDNQEQISVEFLLGAQTCAVPPLGLSPSGDGTTKAEMAFGRTQHISQAGF